VSENTIAISTGIMNLGSGVFGGVPMCHGAGGMAGHVAFGARTGGAPIILGVLLLVLALFFSGSVQFAFELVAHPVLGVILFLTGAHLHWARVISAKTRVSGSSRSRPPRWPCGTSASHSSSG